MMPQRIQRRRSKGWKMPDNTIYVGRPSPFKNQFRVGGYFIIGDPGGHSGPFRMAWCETLPSHADERFTFIKDRATAVEMYERYLETDKNLVHRIKQELRGKCLACWCPIDQPCHADVLLRIANE